MIEFKSGPAGFDLAANDAWDNDDELRLAIEAVPAYLGRGAVRALRDHLTCLLGDGPRPAPAGSPLVAAARATADHYHRLAVSGAARPTDAAVALAFENFAERLQEVQ